MANDLRRLDPDERAILERWARGRHTPQYLAQRSRIVLLTAGGAGRVEVATRLGISRPTVLLWLKRFSERGSEGLIRDAPGRGRKRRINPEQIESLLRLQPPPVAGSRTGKWTVRALAACLDISPASVHRILQHSRQITGDRGGET